MSGVQWRGSSPDLPLRLTRDSSEPLGLQLQQQLREAIRAGRLAAGERLPSTRALAEALDVSRGMVVEAFQQLLGEGYLVARPGAGTVVAPAYAATSQPFEEQTPVAPVDVDFEYGIPDLSAFPMQDWLWAIGETVRTIPFAMMGDEENAGSPVLRSVVAAYHRRVRAGSADPADTVIVGGFRQGLNFVMFMLAAMGHRRIALEDPGPREHDEMARRAGLEPVPVRVDEEGLDTEALVASGATAVLLTPAHQCPSGVVLSPQRRQHLLTWAEEVDGWVIEDDYDAEFRYDKQPVGSMQGLAPARVIAIGSVSKTLAPGMRIGWVITPPQLTGLLLDQKRLFARGVPSLDQAALAHLIESGRYDRFVRQMRKVYAGRREVLVSALADRLPQHRLDGLVAGCHGVLRLPEHCDEEEIVARALERSVRVYGMNRYRLAPGVHPPALVLGFGNLTEAKIVRGVAQLAEIIRQLS
jgi:GntR family transcriptional regulator / MocR family aminotransferase